MISPREHKLDRLKSESKPEGAANEAPTCEVPIN